MLRSLVIIDFFYDCFFCFHGKCSGMFVLIITGKSISINKNFFRPLSFPVRFIFLVFIPFDFGLKFQLFFSTREFIL